MSLQGYKRLKETNELLLCLNLSVDCLTHDQISVGSSFVAEIYGGRYKEALESLV